MKILYILISMVLPILAREITISWDIPEKIPDVGYYVYRWSTNPLTDSNVVDTLDDWRYKRFVWQNHSVRVIVPNNEISYFGVLSHDYTHGFAWSQIIKNTPRPITLQAEITNHPNTGLLNLKITIMGDAGTFIGIQSSSDLVNWEFDRNAIIGDYYMGDVENVYIDNYNHDKVSIYYGLTNKGFFRAYKAKSNTEPTLLIEFVSITQEEIVNQTYPIYIDPYVDGLTLGPSRPTTPYRRPDKKNKRTRSPEIIGPRRNKK